MQNNTSQRLFRGMFSFFAAESILSLIWIFLTPTDVKNAFLLGFSVNRWLMIVFILCLVAFSIIGVVRSNQILSRVSRKVDSTSQTKTYTIFTCITILFLWFVIWLSPGLLPRHTYEIERLKPVLVLVIAMISEFVAFFYIRNNINKIKERLASLNGSKKLTLIFGGILLALIVLFLLLKFLGQVPGEKSLSFPPGVPITPFQLITGLLVFFFLFLLPTSGKNKGRSKIWLVLIPFFIWVITFAAWSATPFTCADDRPGPYLPNNVCYPQVDDSVFSIGSHYITLGRGVFNHWFTDKPFYMLFLAITQFIAGPHIDHYLLVQSALLSLIPVLLYLLGKKFAGLSGGFMLGYLSLVMGINNIRYYATTGGINVKLENSEILTSLLLILFCLIFLQYFLSHGKLRWALLGGGMLGLATLTRMNPVFIVPGIILFLLIVFWKQWRKWIFTSLVLIVGFSIVFVPWLFFARDAQGHNYYLQKIENVLFYRYKQQGQAPQEREHVDFGEKSTVDLVTFVQVKATNVLSDQQDDVYKSTVDAGNKSFQISNVIYHFLNNEFISLAKLPVNLRIIRMEQVLKQTLWSESHRLPFWKLNFSVENYVTLCLSLILVLTGLWHAIRNWGITGLLPLVIQLSYHLANGFALTSGERYLEPVEWVTFLYFSLGIFTLCQVLTPGLSLSESFQFHPESVQESVQLKDFMKVKVNNIVLAGLVIIGALLPAAYVIPDRFKASPEVNLVDYTKNVLVQNKLIKWKDLQAFLKDPKSIVVEGFAYHPRVYASPLVLGHQEVFELTVLGKDRVYISSMLNYKPSESFIDGSKVILFGCKIKEKNFWGAKSVMMRTIGFITLENKQVYKNRWAKLKCP